MRWRPRSRAAAAALAAAAVLTGCADEPLPEPRPVEVDGPVPVVLEPQVERIVDDLATALREGDEAQDPAPLQRRVDGAALELRQVRYTVQRQLPDQPAPPPLAGDLILDAAPAAEGWPRFFLTATTPQEAAVPRLQVLAQAGPREPYRLTAWVRLLPGVTLPEISLDEPPEALPGGDADGLPASPADVLARYSDVLDRGEASEHAAAFGEDAFRAQVLAEQEAEREAVSAFFSYSVDHVARPDALWALRTADGGAIVVGVLDVTRAFTVTDRGARLPLPADLAALAGTAEATEEAAVRSVEMVAFAVPPEGGDEPVTVLGGERGVVSVTAS